MIGPRRVALISIVTFSLTMMSFAFMNGSISLWLGTWCVLAFAGAGTLPITWTRAVTSWFFEKRGLALGFSLIGTGLFGLLAKQYAFFMIELVGWRMAYVAVGALPLLIAFPVAWLMFRDASDPKVADKVRQLERKTQKARVNYGGLSLLQALRDWRFWLLAYSFIPISFAVGGPIPNMETLLGYVAEKGIDTRRLMFCSDDKNPYDLLNEGHIDFTLKQAMKIVKQSGGRLTPIDIIRMATITPAPIW